MKYLSLLLLFTFGCSKPKPSMHNSKNTSPENMVITADTSWTETVVKSEEDWANELSPEQYRVLREKGTESSFTSPLNKNDKKGIYVCAACKNPLFASETKFDSGTGWPSFYAPISVTKSVEGHSDTSYGMVREETVCKRCKSHLGHVFDDGPNPTGLRYCMNGVSLEFIPDTTE